MLPDTRSEHVLGLDSHAAVAAVTVFDMKKQGKTIRRALLERQVIGIEAVSGIATKEYLFGHVLFSRSRKRLHISIGLGQRPDPGLDREAIRKPQICWISQFNLTSHIGNPRRTMVDHTR